MSISILSPRRILAGLAVAATALLVSACVFAPGRFTARLDIQRDHTFTFRYTGELIMIPLKDEEEKASKPFEPKACEDEDTLEERACTDAEIEEQLEEWREDKAQNAQLARSLLGGMDPGDPAAGRELARKLSRRLGWNKVEYLGKGVFDVDYAITGHLDQDFVFPAFEDYPMANAFIQILPRKDGSVRINAPAFGPQQGSGMPAAAFMPGLPASSSDNSNAPNEFAEGTFSIHTNGEILANNTDEGPTSDAQRQVLNWIVNSRTPAAPTALIQLAP